MLNYVLLLEDRNKKHTIEKCMGHCCYEDILMWKKVRSILSIDLSKGTVAASLKIEIEMFWCAPSEIHLWCSNNCTFTQFNGQNDWNIFFESVHLENSSDGEPDFPPASFNRKSLACIAYKYSRKMKLASWIEGAKGFFAIIRFLAML